MADVSRRNAVLTLLVTATLLSTGAVGVGFAENPTTPDAQMTTTSTDAPDGSAIVENFTQRINTLETVEFTRTTETKTDNTTTSTTKRIVADLEQFQLRTEIVDSTYASNRTTVVNETHQVTYNADVETTKTYEFDGEALLPQLTQLVNQSAVEYEYSGTDTIDGQDVYVLTGVPQETQDGAVNGSLTVAVNTETYFPVQITTAGQAGQSTLTATQTYANVTLNEEIPDATFKLDTPTDTTQQTVQMVETRSYDEYSALQSDATLSIPDAELSGDYEFDSAMIIDGNGYYWISLRYAAGQDTVHVNAQEESPFDWEEIDSYEQVSVGDRTGYYDKHDTYSYLRINANGQDYTVSGELTKDQAIDIATSALDADTT